MKQIFTILFFITITSLAFSQEKLDNPKAPIIEFETLTYDFGEIKQGSEAECVFVFYNVGKDPLIIENVRSSCGCTIPSWSKDPIKKKKQGEIVVQYDTKSIKSFSKTITVYSNAKNSPTRLTIKGRVVPEKKNAKSKTTLEKVPLEQTPKK